MACSSSVATGVTHVATSSSSLSAAPVTSSNAPSGICSSFASHNPRPPERHNLQIHTKSIEQTLIPLVTQITTLVSAPDRPLKAERSRRALGRVGRAVQAAVERFVLVGETIADDNSEIKLDMYEACREARQAGIAIEKLCELQYDEAQSCCTDGETSPSGGSGSIVGSSAIADKGSMVRAARCLLAAVTQVLLLADTIVVKQLLQAKDKVSNTLTRLEGVNNFTEFVKAFSQFGSEMVDFAHVTGDRQNDLKDERRRAQMSAARTILERSTLMLLTASKTCLRHPECTSSRENRDTVFCHMRRAIDLVHYVVKDGLLQTSNDHASNDVRTTGNGSNSSPAPNQPKEDWDVLLTACGAIQQLDDSVEMTRLTLAPTACRERLTLALNAAIERTQDFTDSAYTSHEHRENILLLWDRVRSGLSHVIRAGINLEQRERHSPTEELETAIRTLLQCTQELRLQLEQTALEQAADLLASSREDADLIGHLRAAAISLDGDRFDECGERFQEHVDHLQEVCKLLRHVAPTEALQVQAKYAEITVRIYGPQMLTATHTLSLYPNSKIAKENFQVFSDCWQALLNDVTNLAKEVSELLQGRAAEKHVYMSLPRPGKHGTTSKPLKPGKLDSEEQAKIAKAGLEMKLITSEMDAETDRWTEAQNAAQQQLASARGIDRESAVGVANQGMVGGVGNEAVSSSGPGVPVSPTNGGLDENNDIVKRAKNMSSMAFSMYQFTRGEGTLKTTQDLFTQAEYFAEEANRLYKVVRQFCYQVPAGTLKKELLDYVDQIPTYVQQLQFTVKNPTVGKAATFTKVDAVIQETKNCMNCVSKVVSTCFECANKYNLYMSDTLVSDAMTSSTGSEDHQTSSSMMFKPVNDIQSRLGKYNLDFRGLSPRGRSPGQRGDDDGGGAGGASEGGKANGGAGGDPSI
ncbi:alpha-catulin-like isoform X2 [Daphnia carinata]|uniref:alpha-catulin-like isoform X2 n=1 Tax=Daphnia carinata TaxID=120202 RepID=UPI0028687941|nr:alpha-catulin-like isoform X2 [Daphnia carinata]